jgi:hypothetical protein
MDIDTRISLGIYSKLSIPDEIKSKLEAVIPHPTRLIFKPYSRVSLGQVKNDKYMYAIHSDFGFVEYDRLPMDRIYKTGLNWYRPSVLDPNYKKIMLKAPLVQTCVEHYGKNIMEQPS